MSEEHPKGIGRAGRGAMLLQALKNQPRRPGEDKPSESDQPPCAPGVTPETTQPLRPVGRAALLQNILRGAGRASGAEAPVPSDVVPRGRAAALGRAAAAPLGRGRAAQVLESSSPEPATPGADVSSTSGYGSDLLEKEMEELRIGSYSGSAGKAVDMEANYVRLKTLAGRGIFEYHVSFQPPVDSRNMKFKLMNQTEVRDVTGPIKSFDGSKLYLPVRFPHNEERIQTKMPTDSSEVIVCIKYIKPCSGNDIIHLYNLLFRKIMTVLKMVQVGRNYFDPRGGVEVPKHRLEVWPGYVTAVQDYEGGVMLNCDASFRVLRTITAREVMNEMACRRSRVREDIEEMLVGTIVLTRYNNRTYRIDDVAWNMNPRSTFQARGGKEMSFCEYYKHCYDITIHDLEQPLLINKPEKKINQDSDKIICLVPELCYMTGLTDAMRSDYRVMKDIAAHTKITPANRQLCLQRFMDNINSCPEAKKVLHDWNLEFDSATVAVPGRILEPEKIILKDSSFQSSLQGDWARQLGDASVLVPVHLENWVIVHTKQDTPKVRDFINMMSRVCPSMGIKVNQPTDCHIMSDRTEAYINALRDNVNPRVQLVVIVFPTSRDDRYSAVKKLCCIDMPVPSQVINVRTISQHNKLRSVAAKIAMQINCKLGGELWTLPIPLSNIMVCGMDAYHDKSKKRKSVLGFVASLNHNLSRWFSMTAQQKSGQELGDALRMLFLAALRKFHEVNHQLPQKIFIFRDGVSDGMLDTVSKYEVEQFLACFPNMHPGYAPSLSVVVVQKRINTRIYSKVNGSLENPPPGSVLDHTVTRKRLYDFFLVSQHVNQGTVSPTHFIVAHDSSTLKPDHMQKLTYKTTHMYFNWPGRVRVPAPCMYAHKLAFLVGQNLHKDAHPDLADKLFYL